MCGRRRVFQYRCLLHTFILLIVAYVMHLILCWLLTYINPENLLPKNVHFSSYKNAEKLISSLKSIVITHNETEDFSFVKNANDLRLRNEGYSKYGFNALASRNIGFYRDIPDTRHKLCESLSYNTKLLPNVSIIICFYNEHFDTLIRSVYSIVKRTPSNLLHEIILVDDFSDIENLHEEISYFIAHSPLLKSVVRLFKTSEREGLIRARIFGANHAKGKVLMFLDSHIEVNKQWLEPLLFRISENRSFARVVTPIIDIINPDTLQYSSSPLVRGGFNWGLHFKWEPMPKSYFKSDENFILPIKSPTMAGGLFAMDRDYFNRLGQYDPGMDIWGGENLELSFRIWMCGGTLEIIPCSRVGHIFRARRPYSNGEDTMTKNSLRVAHVWLDQHKENYFNAVPDSKYIDYGNISYRIELRKRLKCESFDWYLQNVYPELILPKDDEEALKKKSNLVDKLVFQRWDERKRNYIDQFQIRLTEQNLCVTSEKDVRTKGSFLVLRTCMRVKNQMWYETDKNELVLAQLLCLDAGTTSDKPKLSKCHELGGSQSWHHSSKKDTAIYNVAAGTCLGAFYPRANEHIIMTYCTNANDTRWNLVTMHPYS